jgi:beta-galactosidase
VKLPAMQLGVCYYPEHWDEATWQPDAARMRDLGLRWVRIGEFAWSRLEPTPGQLRFDWLERSLDTLGDAGLRVMLGTPTATPPKWLVDRYDDLLQVGADGRARRFGSRRHYCYNSPSYRAETERIVTLLAERFGRHQALGAWQTDNEYGCHGTVRCYCPNCAAAFRGWLEARYGTVDALNEAWWNVFWSMEYRDFSEIDLPNLTVTEANPSHSLDFCRFSSDSVMAYNKLQVDILRAHSAQPVTHNAMLYFGDYDAFRLAEDLDILTWDSYPLGMLEQSWLPDDVKARFLRVGHPDLISLMHDLYYGAKGRPFWVIEQQPGQVNWAPSNPLPAPGAVRLWTHQAFAHGADVVSYFRWRAANGAQELMHAGLNHHDGTPDRASAEARQVADELPDDAPPVAADVALLFDFENLWATELQPHAQGWSYWALQVAYYSALRGLGLNVAITHPRRDLNGYRAVFAPALHLVDAALAAHLTGYVAGGGTLVVGPRSGFKTPSNTVHAPAPGPLRSLMGVSIRHVDALRPGLTEHVALDGARLAYATWADLLEPETAQVAARYETPAYAGSAAVTRNAVGAGACYTVGMWGEEAAHRALFARVLEPLGLGLTPLPEGVRHTVRGPYRYTFNFGSEAALGTPPVGVRREGA